MAQAFTMRINRQREWHWLVAISFFLEGIGGGLYLVSLINPFRLGIHLSLAFVLLGVVFLAVDLGNMSRAWRVLARPQTSWISRGSLLIAAFVVFGALDLVTPNDTGLGILAQSLAGLAALGVVLYSGLLVAGSPAVPSWNSALVPALFILYALLGGMGVVFVMVPVLSSVMPDMTQIEQLAMLDMAMIITLLIAHVAVLRGSSDSAQLSAWALLSGDLRLTFLGGVMVAGLVLPLVLTGYVYGVTGDALVGVPTFILGLAGALALAGGALFRYAILKAGTYASLS